MSRQVQEPLEPSAELIEPSGEPTELEDVVNLADFEALARARMAPDAFDYVAGGSWDEVTMADNLAAFRRRLLRPRVLVDVSAIDTSTTILDRGVSLPVGIAPTAFQLLCHEHGEQAGSRAASAAEVVFCLSTLSSYSLEDVASAAVDAGSGPRWFQLYVHKDRAVSRDLVERAAAAGYSALVVTVDLPVGGYRERDLRHRLPYPQRFGNFVAPGTEGRRLLAAIGDFNDQAFTWRDLDWVRGLSDLPLVVKGILTREDAALAVEHGAAGIVVSNHGGRQLDRVPASIDVLEECVDAVAGAAEVYLDGGVRRGTDVLTAQALGARAVFMGRPYLYALAAGGESGVAWALALLGEELRTAMALLGVRSVSEIRRSHVR
ncbi:alpha-hydroxy acid oxidase [soil metagenome]